MSESNDHFVSRVVRVDIYSLDLPPGKGFLNDLAQLKVYSRSRNSTIKWYRGEEEYYVLVL